MVLVIAPRWKHYHEEKDMNVNICFVTLVLSLTPALTAPVFAQVLVGSATMCANKNVVGNAANFIAFASAAAFAALPAGTVKMFPEQSDEGRLAMLR